MFKKSIIFVVLIVGSVFLTTYVSGMVESKHLPSTYDTGLSLNEAFKTSEVPLLVEFYADSCQSCRRLAPLLHEVSESYNERLTSVMLDVTQEETQMVAELFGLEELPGLYIFDFKNMKKEHIEPEYFLTSKTLTEGINLALERIEERVKTPSKKPEQKQASL